MNEPPKWDELIDRHLRGELSESEKEQLAERLDSDASAREDFIEQVRWDTHFAEVLHEKDEAPEATRFPKRRPAVAFSRTLLAAAATIIIALAAGLFLQLKRLERPIARITGLSGSFQWTGDGGRVSHNLESGAELSAGTIEGMLPGSWFELAFTDGSTVTIFGSSTLTLSDHGQKELHLKEGSISGNVRPQPARRPMLVRTRSALLEVLGTQFEVEVRRSSTMLNVNEGRVRVTRFCDGRTVDVPARHRVIAAADQEMRPLPVPDSVNSWKSQLHLGPRRLQGKWLPATDTRDATLAAIPYTTPSGKTIYTVGLGVSRGDMTPVNLRPGSRLQVRGRVRSPQKVYVGVTVRDADGAFAGRFQVTRPAEAFSPGQDFDLVLQLGDFKLDPSLKSVKNKLPGTPFNLLVETIWCHTLDKQAGLEILSVELIPSVDEKVAL
jgi:ferric-dicitrate binding protein FerR (iron transport regulator)